MCKTNTNIISLEVHILFSIGYVNKIVFICNYFMGNFLYFEGSRWWIHVNTMFCLTDYIHETWLTLCSHVELWQWGAYWLFGYIFRRAFLPAINRFGWGHRLLQSTQGNLWKGCDKLWWPTKVWGNGPIWLIFLKRLETHRLEVLEYGHRNLSSNSFNKHIWINGGKYAQMHDSSRSTTLLQWLRKNPWAAQRKRQLLSAEIVRETDMQCDLQYVGS